MVGSRSHWILCIAAVLTQQCLAVQYVTAPRSVDSKELHAEAAAFAQEATTSKASGSDGLVQSLTSRLREDFEVLLSWLPKPASKALGFVQEEQDPGHLNPTYREKQRQEQAERDARNATVVQCIFMAIFALIYHEYKARPPVDAAFGADAREKLNGEWESGYFSCFNDMNSCLVGCCCPLILFADNVDMLHVMAFWTALAIAIAFMLGNAFLYGIGFLNFVFLLWGRVKFRQKFNMPFGTPQAWCEDCVCLLCCTSCSICMDHRHLDAACKAGHEAVAEEKEAN